MKAGGEGEASMDEWKRWVIGVWLAVGGCVLAGEAEPPLFQIRQGEQVGLIDRSGRVIVPPEFPQPPTPGDPLIRVRKGSRTAYYAHDGSLAIAPQEELTEPFSEGLAPSLLPGEGGKRLWGYVDAGRAVVIPGRFQAADGFSGGLARVGVADEWGELRYGYIDRSGRVVVPAIHAKAHPARDGIGRVESPRGMRAFDANGRDITPEGVDFIGLPAEGTLRIWSGRKQGFMELTGKLIVAPLYASASDFREGMARVWIDGKFGFVDRSGRVVIGARFDAAEDFSDGLALVREGETRAFIDKTGKVALSVSWERVSAFGEGLAAAKEGKLWGYVDRGGRWVIAPRYTYARPFWNGLAAVSDGPRSAWIDRRGTVVWQDHP